MRLQLNGGLVWRGGIFTLRHSPYILLLLNPTPWSPRELNNYACLWTCTA